MIIIGSASCQTSNMLLPETNVTQLSNTSMQQVCTRCLFRPGPILYLHDLRLSMVLALLADTSSVSSKFFARPSNSWICRLVAIQLLFIKSQQILHLHDSTAFVSFANVCSDYLAWIKFPRNLNYDGRNVRFLTIYCPMRFIADWINVKKLWSQRVQLTWTWPSSTYLFPLHDFVISFCFHTYDQTW